MAYNSLIFDMDGVILNSLVDSERWKYEAVDSSLEKEGLDPSSISKKDKDALLGDKGYKACLKKAKDVGVDPREVWRIVAQETSAARQRQIDNGDFELYPEAMNTIEALHQEDIPMAIISNAPESAVQITIQNFDLKRYFKFYAGVRNFEDLQARKPHPNHLELAKAELKRSPSMYVGDAESDLVAARRASLDSVWVHRRDVALEERPDYTIDSLDRLLDIVL